MTEKRISEGASAPVAAREETSGNCELPGAVERFVGMVEDEGGRWHALDQVGNFVRKYAEEEMAESQMKYPHDRYRISIRRTEYRWDVPAVSGGEGT